MQLWFLVRVDSREFLHILPRSSATSLPEETCVHGLQTRALSRNEKVTLDVEIGSSSHSSQRALCPPHIKPRRHPSIHPSIASSTPPTRAQLPASPANMALPPAHDTSFPGGSLPTPRTPPVRRPQGRPSSTKWAELKPIIHQLYITEDKTLKEVAEVMRMAYAFAPTERSFKRWIAAWGWRKNIHLSHATDDDNAVHAALQIRGRRAVNHHDDGEASSSTAQLQHQKRYVRLANGHCVDAERLAEYIRRRRARLLSTSAHSQEGHHPEQATAPAARLSPSVRAPDNLRACEAILLQTRRYTHGRHGDQDAVVVGKLDTRAKARLLLQYRDCSVRWLSFVGGVKAALASSSRSSGSSSSSTALLAARMQRAPERLAAMIALQPYSILPSLFMFILQTSAGGDSGDDDGDGDAARLQLHVPREDRAQLAAVVRALLRYGVTVAMDLGMPRVHPLPQLLAALPMVEEGDLGEVVRRSFGWTSKWWGGGVSLEGILDAEIAGICSRNWVRGGEKGDIIVREAMVTLIRPFALQRIKLTYSPCRRHTRRMF